MTVLLLFFFFFFFAINFFFIDSHVWICISHANWSRFTIARILTFERWLWNFNGSVWFYSRIARCLLHSNNFPPNYSHIRTHTHMCGWIYSKFALVVCSVRSIMVRAKSLSEIRAFSCQKHDANETPLKQIGGPWTMAFYHCKKDKYVF